MCLGKVDFAFKLDEKLLKATGTMAPMIHLYLDYVQRINVTVILSDAVESLVNESELQYSGCIGSLQRNDSDIMTPGFTIIPIMAPNLTHTRRLVQQDRNLLVLQTSASE